MSNAVIIDANYIMSWGEPIIQLFCKTENNKNTIKTIKNFYPYFYLECDEVDISYFNVKIKDVQLVERYHPIGYQTKKTLMWKVVLFSPIDVRQAREDARKMPGFTAVYEADVLFKNRAMCDLNLSGMGTIDENCQAVPTSLDIPLKYLSMDIEVLVPKTGGMPSPGRDSIIIISLAFSPNYCDEESIVLYSDNEKELLSSFKDIFLDYDPDVICGHNIDGFDWHYILTRCRHHNIWLNFGRDGSNVLNKSNGDRSETRITGRICFDTLPAIRKSHNLPQYRLKDVAKLVGLEKGDVDPKEMRQLWETKDQRFLDYARQDAVIVLKLMTELKLLEKYIELARLSGQLVQDVINGGQTVMIESLLLREFRSEDRVMAMKPYYQEGDDDSKYEGAIVIDTVKGLHENVVILDFQSLYPTIVMAHNICYTTYINSDIEVDCEITPIGAKFVKQSEYIGIMPRVLRRLFDARLSVKAEMKKTTDERERSISDARQNAIKILLNSFYGYAGYTKSRLFTLDVAASVTAYGRVNLLDTINFIETNYGYKVIAGDTDSVFIKVTKYDGDYKQLGEQIATAVSARLPAPMKLTYEAYCSKGIFLAKKRYAINLRENGKNELKMRGLETRRTDWCPLAGETLNKIITAVLQDGDVDKAICLAKQSIDYIKNVKNDDLTKLILTRKYRGENVGTNEQPHDRVAKLCKERGTKRYVEGDRVSFVVISGHASSNFSDSHIQSDNIVDRVDDPDYVRDNNLVIDTDYYISRQIVPPVLRLLEVFGVTEDHITGRRQWKAVTKTVKKQGSLFDFA